MRIKLLPSAVGNESDRNFSMSLVVNDVVAFDAGCIGYLPSLAEQKRIEVVFLSHSHLDHVASLPVFLDNVYEYGPRCPDVYAGPSVIESLKSDLFNDRVWPDFLRLSADESPFLKLHEIQPETPVRVNNLSITPVALDHVVPTFGYLIEDSRSTVAVVCDTSPTVRIWEILNATPDLAAVFIEASFPNSLQWLADKTRHLTPSTLLGEIEKLRVSVPIYVVHIKPTHHDQIVSELMALNRASLHVAQPGRSYEF